MTAVTQRMSGQPLRAVFPVHSRRGPDSDPSRWQNSVGWFITNSVLECTSTDPAECADAVRAAVRLGGHPLAPILDPDMRVMVVSLMGQTLRPECYRERSRW